MEETLTYEETLVIVEKFMRDSGIRDFCAYVCKGHCCENCFESSKSCIKNEKRRLPCSIFICGKLLEVLKLNERQKNAYTSLGTKIQNEINIIMTGTTGSSDCYFSVNTPKIQKQFSISKELINEFNKVFNKEKIYQMQKDLRNITELLRYRIFASIQKRLDKTINSIEGFRIDMR